MKIVGVSADYHDAAAALVIEGQVVAAASEERLSRVRHDASFPALAIESCLGFERSRAPVDLVAYYEDPVVKFTRVLTTSVAHFPGSAGVFVGATRRWLREKLWMRERLAKHFDLPARRVVAVPHHTSHAAQAFFPSPFARAAIITLDAVGEWTCSAVAEGDRSLKSAPIRLLLALEYPHSLGLFYSCFTQFLGFTPNSDECSTMALSAFGMPRYVDRVRKVLSIAPDGSHRLDSTLLNPVRPRAPFQKGFFELFGAPRAPQLALPFDVYDPSVPIDDRSRYFADVAASVQVVLEDAVLAFARRARSLSDSGNLCLSGGVALNCVANARLIASGLFEDVFVPPDPGDGGAALGAALYAAALHAEPSSTQGVGPYLGRSFDVAGWELLLAELQRQGGSELPHFQWQRLSNASELSDAVAALLADGEIVGWHRERAEFGPRALGNRSILAAAHDVAIARRLSSTVKLRAAFRPYAIVSSEDCAQRAFEFGDRVPRSARWMQTVVRAKPAYLSKLRGGLHIDDTTRIQVCSAEDNPALHGLLRAYGRRTGIEALINTSLNLRGEPIAETPLDSLSLFLRSALDRLVIDDLLIWKGEVHRP